MGSCLNTPEAKRWRQQGMEDVDTSNIDPATRRQKQLDLSAMEPPPMGPPVGPPPIGAAGCSRQGPASLYVDPLAPPRAAVPAPAPMKPQQFVAPPVEHSQGKVAIHAATGKTHRCKQVVKMLVDFYNIPTINHTPTLQPGLSVIRDPLRPYSVLPAFAERCRGGGEESGMPETLGPVESLAAGTANFCRDSGSRLLPILPYHAFFILF